MRFSGLKAVPIRVIDSLKRALFPKKCLVCDSFFHSDPHSDKRFVKMNFPDKSFFDLSKKVAFERLMAAWLCPLCRCNFHPVESPVCSVCGIMFKSRTGEDHLCGDCLRSPKKFKTARTPGVYDEALMAMIHLLKYKGKLQLARPLGMLLFFTFARSRSTARSGAR